MGTRLEGREILEIGEEGEAQGCSTLFTEGHRKYGFETAESGEDISRNIILSVQLHD
jgi:hypothetical protein